MEINLLGGGHAALPNLPHGCAGPCGFRRAKSKRWGAPYRCLRNLNAGGTHVEVWRSAKPMGARVQICSQIYGCFGLRSKAGGQARARTRASPRGGHPPSTD